MADAVKETLRLDRLLADCGVATRRELKEIIRKGRVRVAGEVRTNPAFAVRPGEVEVLFDGHPVVWKARFVLMMNKPAGVITATEDPRLPTVLDLLPEQQQRMGLIPVGRLDRDTEGLLLLTSDGQLAHALLAPKHHVDKLYEAVLDAEPIPEAEKLFGDGVVLADGTVCRPAVLERRPGVMLEGVMRPVARVTIVEGKFHQVKRMFLAAGSRVLALKRLRMGPLWLDPSLAPGAARELTTGEVARLEEER
jgi:16S rRNA pseudouridine516 synthase